MAHNYRISSSLTSSHTSLSSSMSTTTTGSETTLNRIRQYPVEYPGPFIVNIRSSPQKLNHSYVANYLFQSRNGIKSCRKVTTHLSQVECKSAAVANEIPHDRNLSRYHVCIPAQYVEVEGVIYYPPINDITLLFKDDSYGFHFDSGHKTSIVDVQRFNARRVDKDTKVTSLVPSPLVKVTFMGQQIPNAVMMDLNSVEISSRAYSIWSRCGPCGTLQIPVKVFVRSTNSNYKFPYLNGYASLGSCLMCLRLRERGPKPPYRGKATLKEIQEQKNRQQQEQKQHVFEALTEVECP